MSVVFVALCPHGVWAGECPGGRMAGLSCHRFLRRAATCPSRPRADVRPGPQGDTGVRKSGFLTRNTRSVRSHRTSHTWGPHAATGREGNVTELGRDRRAAPVSQWGGRIPDPAGGLTATSRRPARGHTSPWWHVSWGHFNNPSNNACYVNNRLSLYNTLTLQKEN